MACKSCVHKPVYVTQNHGSLCANHFVKYVEKKVFKTIRQYQLIQRGDTVAVALSGGKDSSTLLNILKKLQDKYHGFSLKAVLIDEGIAGYRPLTIKDAKKFCQQLKVPLEILSFKSLTGKTLDQMQKTEGKNPCSTCGVLRRYLLNKGAKLVKASKIATGHNVDDEAQSILMNSIKGNVELSAKLGPISGLKVREEFVTRIKPLYFLLEKEVLIYAKVCKLPVTFVECPNTRLSFRNEVGRLLNELEGKYPGSKQGIINSFLTTLPLLKKEFSDKVEELRACEQCGEPSVHALCRACQVINIHKKKSKGN
ncbi:MAG: TIGR00269 family protein [Nanoarchaeota archaeon]|nr:TIGR00269 family protein [Nanoarchaeota archaeon]